MQRIWLAVGGVAVLACASSGRNGSSESRADFVTAAELQTSGQTMLEAALRELRPRWFNIGRETVSDAGRVQPQGRGGRGIVVCRINLFVYVDGERSDASLSMRSVTGVVGVRFLRSAGMRPDGNRDCPEVPSVNVLTREEESRASN